MNRGSVMEERVQEMVGMMLEEFMRVPVMLVTSILPVSYPYPYPCPLQFLSINR